VLPYTPSELVAEAWLAIHGLRGALASVRSLRFHSGEAGEGRMPVAARVDEDVRLALLNGYLSMQKQYLALKARAREIVGRAAGRLPYIAYLLDTPLVPESLLAVLAHPPDLTLKRFGPAVKPASWIAVSFIPTRLRDGRVHRPLLAKFFYTANYTVMVFRHEHFALCGRSQALCEFYRRKVEEEKRKPTVRSEGHARRRAVRDVVRVYLGNAWLIAMLDALDRGAIDRDEVVLPYWLAKSPRTHVLLDPSQAAKTPGRWREYTWDRLLRTLGL